MHNSNAPAQNVYLPGAQRNAPQVHVGRTAYTTPISAAPPKFSEEALPSYEKYMSSAKVQQQQ
jgi:hypothetical protein